MAQKRELRVTFAPNHEGKLFVIVHNLPGLEAELTVEGIRVLADALGAIASDAEAAAKKKGKVRRETMSYPLQA